LNTVDSDALRLSNTWPPVSVDTSVSACGLASPKMIANVGIAFVASGWLL